MEKNRNEERTVEIERGGGRRKVEGMDGGREGEKEGWSEGVRE